ncbi:MAG: hypothetical protein IOD12_09455 [Silvanigrellales bacterium]|nr:hypothetical protein [Silvanigrellales bacterium]
MKTSFSPRAALSALLLIGAVGCGAEKESTIPDAPTPTVSENARMPQTSPKTIKSPVPMVTPPQGDAFATQGSDARIPLPAPSAWLTELTDIRCEGGSLTIAARTELRTMRQGLVVKVPGQGIFTVKRRNLLSGVGATKALTKTSITTILDSKGHEAARLVIVMRTTEARTTTAQGETRRFTHTKPEISELVLVNGFNGAFLVHVLERALGNQTPTWAKSFVDKVMPSSTLSPETRAASEILHALGLLLNDILVPTETHSFEFRDGHVFLKGTSLEFQGTTPASKSALALVPAVLKERAYDIAMCGVGRAVRVY